ncbi:AAA family ATPase [Candidatus Poribacteria bacterium]|nr:AAA family ATPase [Candidatus Poribacteria bacterium]
MRSPKDRDADRFTPDDERRGRPLGEDSDRTRRGRPFGDRAFALVNELLAATDERDARRSILYQLRRQIIEDEQAFEDVQQAIAELEEAVTKLTSPANRIGVYLGQPREGIAHVALGGSDYFSNIDPQLDVSTFRVGTRVLLNEAYVVVGDLGYAPTGAITRVANALEDGRIRIGQEPSGASAVLERSDAIRDSRIKTGDEVRVDASSRVALEVFPAQETKDYYLDEVPELPWEKVGGQDEAIRAIKDAIEMPVLHPDLFERFQFKTPKGFLLYGPPGCGKTLIGKATAHNLVEQLKKEAGKQIEGQFLHIKGPEILNMWLGESERKVREIFALAREKRKQGILPFVFIDEAEAVLGTRRALRSHNISNTVVPMFCAEMDGIESLRDIVIILATNRPDLIDPAILRPGRIDRKIKVTRPDRDGTREIFRIYLNESLPISADLVVEHDGSASAAVDTLIEAAMEDLFARRDDTRFLEVTLNSGTVEVLHRGDLVSGAIVASIVERAKELAIKRSVAQGEESGITRDDVVDSIAQEYRENDIFPPSDNADDWLKLIDYDPENVARVSPIRPKKGGARRRDGIL